MTLPGLVGRLALGLALGGASFVGGGWLSDRRHADMLAQTHATVDSLRLERARDSVAIARIRDSLALLATIEARQARELADARGKWGRAAALADSAMGALELMGIESASAEELRAALVLQTDARFRAEERGDAAEAQLGTVADERDLARQEITRLTSMLSTADTEAREWKQTAEAMRPPRWSFRDGVAVGGIVAAAAGILVALTF